MLNLPFKSTHCIGPVCIAIFCLLLALTSPVSTELFAYNRNAINDWQIWRLLSGHFLHTNLIHLMLNLAGLLLLWALHGHYYKTKQYVFQFAMLCLGTSFGIYVFASSLIWYVGLSGVLHGLFVLGAYYDIRHGLKSGWILLVGVWVKVLHEQIYGASEDIAHLINANVAIDAHLFGTISGTLIIMYYLFVEKDKEQNRCV